MVNIIATLTSNLMFYNISTYREFFLTTAQLPESILNLSAFLGYDTTEASYSQAGILVTIPFGFDISPPTVITLPATFKFYAGDIEFITDYITTITITNNSTATVIVQEIDPETNQTKIYNLPITIETGSFSFVLVGKQYKNTQQEFQIDEDLLPYQFVTLDVPTSGQIASLTVELQEPGSNSWTLFTEQGENSLYLMSPTDKEYVSRRTGTGIRLYFGNGVIGVQPTKGSTVRVTARETLAERGNVIAGSITRGDRIYTSTGGVTKILNYTVVNPTSSTGGKDEESLEDIRSNSIASLTALHRLVSESDYMNANVVLENSQLAENSLPVLKRSDLKVNDIQLFTTLKFADDFVPTRDASYITLVPPSGEVYIPRNSIIKIDDVDYLTLFDMRSEKINKVVYYQYIMSQLQVIPMLVKSWDLAKTYNIAVTSLLTRKNESAGIFELFYYTTESDATSCDCEMEFLQDSVKRTMTNDTVNKKFVYVFDPYTLIPEGELDIFFTISRLGINIAQYEAKLTFRSPLDSFMMSEMLMGEDSTTYAEIGIDSSSCIIFDIPVVKKDYYEDLDDDEKRSFEGVILQALLSTTDFERKRMLTDFTNLKFSNTTGLLKNMQLNTVTKLPVIDIVDRVADVPNDGDRYIIDNEIIDGVEQPRGMIAEFSYPTGWTYTPAVIDDIVYVAAKECKYIYSEGQWVLPVYQIPIEIELEIIRAATFAGSDIELSNAIKTAIYDTFKSRFGTNVALYRSEIIDVVHNVDGVGHCRLVRPESSIFYKFDIHKFDQYKLSYFMSSEDEQIKLMLYGPEYTFFTKENITITIL
jgi:hypothetical protein